MDGDPDSLPWHMSWLDSPAILLGSGWRGFRMGVVGVSTFSRQDLKSLPATIWGFQVEML
jgi:hypothetical protein